MFIGDPVIPLLWHSVAEFKKMPTAILRFLTTKGFVIAADGLSRDRETGETHSKETKLYRINDPSRSLVWALSGTARIKDPTDTHVALDLVAECSRAVTVFSKQMPSDLLVYARTIAGRLQSALENSKNAGKISRFPLLVDPSQPDQCLIATLFFWGYYEGVASRAVVKITHRNQSLSPLQSEGTMVDPWPEISGSGIFNLLLRETPDPRLAKFWIPAMAKLKIPFSRETLSVAEARDIAVNYIHACESKEGRAIDPDLAPGIGGRIHIATITPEDGAQWMAEYEA
jgi:hypothetical protein